jgi:hypothetical protein
MMIRKMTRANGRRRGGVGPGAAFVVMAMLGGLLPSMAAAQDADGFLRLVKVVDGGDVDVSLFEFDVSSADMLIDTVQPIADEPNDGSAGSVAGSNRGLATRGEVVVVIPARSIGDPLTVEEIGGRDYVAVFGGACSPSGRVVVTAGEVTECTITNTFTAGVQDADALVTLDVTIDSSGASLEEFTYDISALTGVPVAENVTVAESADPGATTGTTTVPVLAEDGPFTVEVAQAPDQWATTFAGDCDPDGGITPQIGTNATCTITHTYVGTENLPQPEPPNARNDAVSQRGPDAIIDVLGNDDDPDDDLDPSTLRLEGVPGCVTAGTCTVEIRPDLTMAVTAINGAIAEQIPYTVCDFTGRCDTAIVDVRLSAIFVRQGQVEFVVTPLSTNEDVAAFYGYDDPYNASSALDLQQSETSRLFLYTDGISMSLVMLHDSAEEQRGETPATPGQVKMTISYLPSGSSWSVLDDPGDDDYAIAVGETTVEWAWIECCTDGGAISVGADLPLAQCVHVDLTESENITGWQFLSGNPSTPDVSQLSMASPTVDVQICHEHAQP